MASVLTLEDSRTLSRSCCGVQVNRPTQDTTLANLNMLSQGPLFATAHFTRGLHFCKWKMSVHIVVTPWKMLDDLGGVGDGWDSIFQGKTVIAGSAPSFCNVAEERQLVAGECCNKEGNEQQ
eukprot:1118775-Amphidinium_carterae.3